jgi:uncharacterized membrane protein YfcA
LLYQYVTISCTSNNRKFRWYFAGTHGLTESAGIGGGPIINICLMIGLGYTSKAAMDITYIFLMGGSIASVIQNLPKRRPNGHLLIDYNLVMLTAPMITSGSIFGVHFLRYRQCFTVSYLNLVLPLLLQFC